MFGVKIAAWPSPHDVDLTVELFEQWRDELVTEGKLIPYEARGKRYLYIPGMAAHEAPRNPQRPDCDLPPWVEWVPNEKDTRKGMYQFSEPSTCDDVEQALNNDCTTLEQASPLRPVPLRTVPSSPPVRPSQVGTGPPVDNFQGEEGFEIDDPDPPPLLIGPDNVTVERFGALHAAIAVKFGDLEAARTTPAVLDAIRSTCRSDCRGLHCRSCAIDPAIERVHHTKHPSKLAEFVRKELAG